MYRFKLLSVFVFFFLSIEMAHSQDYQINEKSIVGVFDAPGKSQSEIFSSINRWISLNYNSAQNVVQLNDKEAGNIIVKGINEVVYKNLMKEVYPNNKYMQEYSTTKFNHTMEINTKDDKYRVVYTLTDIPLDPVMKGYEHINDMVFDLVDLTGVKDEAINTYNIYMEEMFKKGFVGKKKREKILSMTKPVWEQVTKDIILNIEGTMKSIESSITSSADSDW